MESGWVLVEMSFGWAGVSPVTLRPVACDDDGDDGGDDDGRRCCCSLELMGRSEGEQWLGYPGVHPVLRKVSDGACLL